MYVTLPKTAPMEISGAATATSASRRLKDSTLFRYNKNNELTVVFVN